jgi:hypothetical protein
MADQGKPTPDPSTASDWRDLAAQASKEADPQKLSQLVQELCDRLDDVEQQKKRPAQAAASRAEASKQDEN